MGIKIAIIVACIIMSGFFSATETAFSTFNRIRVKGKGVSYMENKCEWHGQAPKEDLYKVAIEDLTKIAESLK